MMNISTTFIQNSINNLKHVKNICLTTIGPIYIDNYMSPCRLLCAYLLLIGNQPLLCNSHFEKIPLIQVCRCDNCQPTRN